MELTVISKNKMKNIQNFFQPLFDESFLLRSIFLHVDQFGVLRVGGRVHDVVFELQAFIEEVDYFQARFIEPKTAIPNE